MDFTYGLIGLIAGLIIGAAAARFYTMRKLNQHKLQQELNESRNQLQQYRQDVSEHLETTNQLMVQLQDNYSKIAKHMAHTKMQLIEQPVSTAYDDLSYLSGDTAAQLRQSAGQIDERRRTHTVTEQQPKDYSGEASGLIKGSRDM